MRRLPFPLLVLFSAAAAQVPDGHVVVASVQEPSNSTYPGAGGLQFAHPRRPGLLCSITSLPPALTGANAPGQTSGARSVLVLPDRDLLAANRAPYGLPIEIHRLRLVGSAVAGSSAIPLGTAGSGAGGVAHMALVSPTRVLAVGNGVVGQPVLGASMFLAAVDLASGAVTHPLCWTYPTPIPPNLLVQGVAYDAAADRAYFAVHYNNGTGTPYTTEVWSFTLGSSCTPIRVAAVQGQLKNIAWSRETSSRPGRLYIALAASNRANPAIYHYTPSTGVVSPALTGWDFVQAIAVEATTGELLLCGNPVQNQLSTGGLHWLDTATGQVTRLADNLCSGLPRGPFFGLDAAPDPATFGAASGPAPAYGWSTVPDPARLPMAGNAGFFVDVAWPNGSTPAVGLWAISSMDLSPPVPVLGFDLYVVPMITGTFTLRPQERRSVLTLPIPGALAPGAELYMQAVHAVGSGLHASEGLRIRIL